MNRRSWLLCFFCFIPLAVSGSTDSSVLLTKKGIVQVLAGTDQWIDAVQGQILVDNTKLRTGDDSSATIRLSTGAILRVGEFSAIDLLPVRAETETVFINIVKGLFYFFGRDGPDSISVLTPFATGAIKGTEFALSVGDGGEATFTMLDGTLELSNAYGVVALVSGERATANESSRPVKSLVVDVYDSVQWSLYYPGVLSLDELALESSDRTALTASLAAYQRGDITAAINHYPTATYTASSEQGLLYLANLKMAAGRVEEAEAILATSASNSSFARALNYLVAAVNFEETAATGDPVTASEALGLSYFEQSRQDLEAALANAKLAVDKDARFGYAWARLAELEFSFGHIREARLALETAIELSPDNPQVNTLLGFINAANSDFEIARVNFTESIAKDGTFANAWLGSALLHFREGSPEEGLARLKTAVAMEPNRSILRSYLAKGYAELDDFGQAKHELELAVALDDADPTPVFYGALVDKSLNQFNAAAKGIQKAIDLNDNRAVYRSRMLLDQDMAVRNSNLAAIYHNLSMPVQGKRTASKAVADDYNNYSAHLFLANAVSGGDLLRTDAVEKNEYLLAQMLAPVNAGTLSQFISNQEYSAFFEGKKFNTNYSVFLGEDSQSSHVLSLSRVGEKTSVSLDVGIREWTDYQWERDNDLRELTLTMKHQQSDNSSFFLLAQVNEKDEFTDTPAFLAPLPPFLVDTVVRALIGGYQYSWNSNNNLLILATVVSIDNDWGGGSAVFNLNQFASSPTIFWSLERTELDFQLDEQLYAIDLNHIYTDERKTIVSGFRYSTGEYEAEDATKFADSAFIPVIHSRAEEDFWTFSAYSYLHFKTTEALTLIAGIAFESVSLPANVFRSPVNPGSFSDDQISPKLAFTWEPSPRILVRGIYSESLGGISTESSLRLEPAQIAGFTTSFRGLISNQGDIVGPEYKSWGFGLQITPGPTTYLDFEYESLQQQSDVQQGVIFNDFVAFEFDMPSFVTRPLDFTEDRYTAEFNHLLGESWSWGLSYEMRQIDFKETYLPELSLISPIHSDAELERLTWFANFNHKSGFYGQGSLSYYKPDEKIVAAGFQLTPAPLADESFTLFNLELGYRATGQKWKFAIGVVNAADEDFLVNTLIPFNNVPRQSFLYTRFNVSI